MNSFLKRKREKKRELKIKLFANEMCEKGGVNGIINSGRRQKNFSSKRSLTASRARMQSDITGGGDIIDLVQNKTSLPEQKIIKD